MVRRGWIKIKKIPPRRIGYYLTPHGFTEKSKLTYRFLSNTIHQYATTKKDIARKLLAWERDGVKRIVFYGASDEMEIAYVTLQGVNLELVAIVDDDPGKQNQRLFNLQVVSPQELPHLNCDALLITSVDARKRIRRQMDNHYSGLNLRIESL